MLLVGNTGGNPDEGMKLVLKNLSYQIGRFPQLDVRVANPSSLIRQLRQMRQWKPDIIHYLGGPTYISLAIMILLRIWIPPVKIVVSFIHPKLGSLGSIFLRIISVEKALAQSSRWYSWCLQHSVPVELVPLAGVDTQRFQPIAEEQKTALRGELGIPEDTHIVLHVGHIKEDRNLRVLEYLQKMEEIQVVIIGSTTTKIDDELLDALNNMDCMVLVEFLPEIQAFYQISNCYVFPLVDDQAAIQIPLSVLEGMACNLPVVTTRFGGLEDFFKEGEGLHYIDQLNERALQTAVLVACQSEHVSTRVKVADFDWNTLGQKIVDIYYSLLTGKNE